MRASLVDDYVEQQVLHALEAEDGLLAQAVEASEKIDSAARHCPFTPRTSFGLSAPNQLTF